jgi:hypothetical protein
VGQINLGNERAPNLSGAKDSLDDGNSTLVPQLVLIDIKLCVTEVNDAQRWMVHDHISNVICVVAAVQLVIFHNHSDNSVVLLNSCNNWFEVGLKLIS